MDDKSNFLMYTNRSRQNYAQAYRGTIIDRLTRHKKTIAVIILACVLILFIVGKSLKKASPSMTVIQNGQNTQNDDLKYAIVFDAGSTGSRVHAYTFRTTDGSGMELLDDGFYHIKPGLSAFSDNPEGAAKSLLPLLDNANKHVPASAKPATCMELRATAGLRLLPGSKAEDILSRVRSLLEQQSYKLVNDGVTILDGSDEGAYAWVALNYLNGNLGGEYSTTSAIIDLGGGSVQLAYALSDEFTTDEISAGYVRKMGGGGKSYNVYIHSYLGFGLMAARAELLKSNANTTQENGVDNPCIPYGASTTYSYTGSSYAVQNLSKKANVDECLKSITEFMHIRTSCGVTNGCSFAGAWGGGGGLGLQNVKVLSYFFDRAEQTGIIEDKEVPSAPMEMDSFLVKAHEICDKSITDIHMTYPKLDDKDASFLCFDLLYQHSLLSSGFDLGKSSSNSSRSGNLNLELVKRVRYKDTEVEAGWALGAAINSMNTC